MSGIKISFVNQSQIPANMDVFIGFYTTVTNQFDIKNLTAKGPEITWIYDNLTTNPGGNWYSLADISAGVQINQFIAGRIYVCYNLKGKGGWVPNGKNEPSQALTIGDDVNENFWLRYDKMELTVTPNPNDVADLTSIDFWAIPMNLQVKKNGQVPTGNATYSSYGLKPGVTSQKVFDALLALSNPPVSGIQPQRGQPFPALVPGDFHGDNPPNTQPDPTPDIFARIIGPPAYGTVNPIGFPITPYDTMADYLTHLVDTYGPGTAKDAVLKGLGAGVIAKVAGTFTETGTGAQVPYSLDANIDASGNITLTAGSTGQPAGTTIEVKQADLVNPSGLYGANPPNVVNGNQNDGLTNDIYGWMIADLLGGLNIGAVGSITKINGTAVGLMNSNDWFSLDPSQMFANLQPTKPSTAGRAYYNQYAATLQPLSDAYNFAFSDRLEFPGGNVQVTLNQAEVDELEITLLDATVTPMCQASCRFC